MIRASEGRSDFLGLKASERLAQALAAHDLGEKTQVPDLTVRYLEEVRPLFEGWILHMEVPSNLDSFLKDMLAEEEATVALDAEDRAFVDRILKSITTGSKGIFVVLHPNDRMQYMLLNTNRAGAIALLARVMQRTAEALEADLD
jgi:hypothetical protein